MISLSGVSKAFKKPATNPFKRRELNQALQGVDISIAKGEITCLLGPNGAGKTTLIKILASLITPDAGRITCDGIPIERWDGRMQGRIGLVTPNERAFYWRLTGRQNLAFFGALFSLRGRELGRRVDEALEEAGLSEDADKPYRHYSSGMKQRLNIARALIGNPELYLLDEPAAHLDPLARADFWEFVSVKLKGRRGATVFLCTHDLEEARRLADRFVILHKGRVVEAGTRAELLGILPGTARMELLFRGSAPAAWMERYSGLIVGRSEGRLDIAFDPSSIPQERLLRDFVVEGGALAEARRVGTDLLDLLERRVRFDA